VNFQTRDATAVAVEIWGKNPALHFILPYLDMLFKAGPRQKILSEVMWQNSLFTAFAINNTLANTCKKLI